MNRRFIIAIAALAVITAAWYFVFAAPQLAEQKKLKATVVESEARLAEMKRIIIEIPNYFSMQQQLTEEKHLLISRLYSKDDLIKLFDEFADKARLHKLELVEIAPSIEELLEINQTIPDENSPRILDITLNLRGTLQTTGEFIAEIEKQNFYKGLNFCRISNPVEKRPYSDVSFGFKAVLGTIKDS